MNTTTATPDQQVTGVNTDGETYNIARYGTTLVLVVADHTDTDEQFANEAEAIAEFESLREAFSAEHLHP